MSNVEPSLAPFIVSWIKLLLLAVLFASCCGFGTEFACFYAMACPPLAVFLVWRARWAVRVGRSTRAWWVVSYLYWAVAATVFAASAAAPLVIMIGVVMAFLSIVGFVFEEPVYEARLDELGHLLHVPVVRPETGPLSAVSPALLALAKEPERDYASPIAREREAC